MRQYYGRLVAVQDSTSEHPSEKPKLAYRTCRLTPLAADVAGRALPAQETSGFWQKSTVHTPWGALYIPVGNSLTRMPSLGRCRPGRLKLGRDAELPHRPVFLCGQNQRSHEVWNFVSEFDEHVVRLPARDVAFVLSHGHESLATGGNRRSGHWT